MFIPHDERSPQPVVDAANDMAMRIWHQKLSFDQAASHRSAICVGGIKLPFNAFCMQPGASGVDTFRCWQSWSENTNFVHPPAPMAARLVTFLPATGARVVFVIPTTSRQEWWHYAILPNSDGFCEQSELLGFLITAFDFSRGNSTTQTAHTGLATLDACYPHSTALRQNVSKHIAHTRLHSCRYRAKTSGCVHEDEGFGWSHRS